MTQTAERMTNQQPNYPSGEGLLNASKVRVSEHLLKNDMDFTKSQPDHAGGFQIGVASSVGEQTYNKRYAQWTQDFINERDAVNPEALADVLNMHYDLIASQAEKNSEVFERPATYVLDDDGNLIWSASNKTETTGLMLVRKDGDIEYLGADDSAQVGVISDISSEDRLFLAPNKVIEAVKETGPDAVRALDQIMSDDTYMTDLICVTFDGLAGNAGQTPDVGDDRSDADTADPADRLTRNIGARQKRAEPRKAARAAKKAARAAKTDGATSTPDTGDTLIPDTDLTQAFADSIDARIAAAAEKQRITDRVEKYTEKVATYEEIAATALAKRMKGRLFNPLRKSKQTEAEKDDLNMHLLEGFSRALDGALMKQWLAEGYSDDEAAQMIYEHQQTRQEARAIRNHEELRKDKLGSFLDKYANMSKGKKVGVAIGAAAAFGAIGVVAGAAGGALAVVGGIGLAGAKVGKTYLQHRSKIYEAGRDESMRAPDKPVSVSNGSTATRTAAQQVFAGMAHDEKKREKAIQKADRNKKVAAGLAAISAVAIGAGVAMRVAEHADDIQNMWNRSFAPVGNADGDWVTEAPTAAPEPALAPIPEPAPAPESIFSADASTVVSGEGWYQTIQETTGVTDPAQQAAILQKIGPALQEKGWAYPMTDGTWGISRPGTLPKDVLELIKNSR